MSPCKLVLMSALALLLVITSVENRFLYGALFLHTGMPQKMAKLLLSDNFQLAEGDCSKEDDCIRAFYCQLDILGFHPLTCTVMLNHHRVSKVYWQASEPDTLSA